MKNPTMLALFLVLSLGGGLSIGILTASGDWYAALNKPFFNPPNWIFGPVWTILYVAIGVAGWRVWNLVPRGNLMRLWFVQMVLNFLWSPAFFAAQKPGLALVIIVMMLIAILAFIAQAWSRDRVAAILFVPYVFWVAFATALNGAIFFLN